MNDPLLSQACSGDASAIETLLLASYDRLVAYLQPRFPQRFAHLIDVEDVLQETFVQAFRDISGRNFANRPAFEGWLRAVAEHRMLDMVKGLQRQKRGGDMNQVAAQAGTPGGSVFDLLNAIAAQGETPSRFAANREAAEALLDSLDRLPHDYAEALRLRYIEGLPEAEVAAKLGRGVDAVRGLCYRGKKMLREAMGNSSLYFDKP